MPSRGSIALLPRTRKGLVLFWTALFMLSVALQYAAATMPKAALATDDCESYAIFTSDSTGETNNENFYDRRKTSSLTAVPRVQVGTSPRARPSTTGSKRRTARLSARIPKRIQVGADGKFVVGLARAFEEHRQPGGSYNVTVSAFSDLHQGGGCTTEDHFKVADSHPDR